MGAGGAARGGCSRRGVANFVSHDLPLLLGVVFLALPGDDLASEVVVFRLHAEQDGSEEGLVRGCACRGAAGFVHVSCLARAAQVPVERRGGLGFGRWYYEDGGATLDDLREAVTTLEEIERIARRVLGRSHPLTVDIEEDLQNARENRSLRARGVA